MGKFQWRRGMSIKAIKITRESQITEPWGLSNLSLSLSLTLTHAHMQAYVFLEIPNDYPWYVVPNSWNHMKGFNEMLIFRSHYGWWAFYEYVHVCVSVCECCFVYVFMWIYNEVIPSAKTSLPWGLERWLAICIQKFIKNKFQCFYINTLSVPLYGKYACKQYLLSMMIIIIHNLNIIGLYSFSLSVIDFRSLFAPHCDFSSLLFF